MPSVSVIVPVYNVEHYLHRCVDSILAQTFPDFELILVDDGSPDNCPAICDEYAEKDQRVRVIHQQNQGQSAARNHAVAQARAEWLCFVDSDDVIHPQFVEILFNAVIECRVQMSMCGLMESDEIPDSFWKKAEADYYNVPVNEDWLLYLYNEDKSFRIWIICAKLIHKNIYVNAPLTEGRVYEDSPAVCKWFLSQKNVANVDCDLYFYRVNPSGTTKNAFSPKQLDRLWAFNEQIQAYDQAGYYKAEKAVFFNFLLYANMFYHNCLEIPEYRKTATSIQKQLHTVYRFVKRNVDISSQKRISIRNILYPRTMKIYHNGMAFLRKIINRLRGRTNAAD